MFANAAAPIKNISMSEESLHKTKLKHAKKRLFQI